MATELGRKRQKTTAKTPRRKPVRDRMELDLTNYSSSSSSDYISSSSSSNRSSNSSAKPIPMDIAKKESNPKGERAKPMEIDEELKKLIYILEETRLSPKERERLEKEYDNKLEATRIDAADRERLVHHKKIYADYESIIKELIEKAKRILDTYRKKIDAKYKKLKKGVDVDTDTVLETLTDCRQAQLEVNEVIGRHGSQLKYLQDIPAAFEKEKNELIQLYYSHYKGDYYVETKFQSAINDMMTEQSKLLYELRSNKTITSELASFDYKIDSYLEFIYKKYPDIYSRHAKPKKRKDQS